MVRISYLEITGRGDYPTTNRIDLHLWEPTLRTLERQTFKDFEYIPIDVCYDERRNYFKENSHGLRIKHIPSAPYTWTSLNLCSSCHQFNQGLIHADGELIVMGGDSAMYPPWYFEDIWERYQKGFFISAGFGSDITFVPELDIGPDNQPGVAKSLEEYGSTSEWFKELGFKGKVIMDHRYRRLFEKSDEGTRFLASLISPQWYYGYSSLTLETALKVNGFDENFDPDVTLADIDFGYRLAMAIEGKYKMAMQRSIYAIEAYSRDWHPKLRRGVEVKCTYALLILNQKMKRMRANEPLSTAHIEYIVDNICWPNGVCDVKETCKTKCVHRAPFYNKNELELYGTWCKQRRVNRDLTIEREARIAGEEHQEGTFVNV